MLIKIGNFEFTSVWDGVFLLKYQDECCKKICDTLG